MIEFIITIYICCNMNIKNSKNIIILKKINSKNNNYFKNFVKIMVKNIINSRFNIMFIINYNICVKSRFNNCKIFKKYEVY